VHAHSWSWLRARRSGLTSCTKYEPKSAATASQPKVRAGFIKAPISGYPTVRVPRGRAKLGADSGTATRQMDPGTPEGAPAL
jgi:hypothetical protein